MLRITKTFDAHAINDGTNYRAWLLNPYHVPSIQPVFVSQANADAVDAGIFTVDPATVVLKIKILNYANRQTLIAQLQGWFKRGTLGDLVMTFSDDGLDYYKPCRVVNIVPEPDYPMHFIVTLNTGWSTWRAVTADTYTWNLTGTGGNHTVTLLGDDETPLSMTFELSAGPANGYVYQRLYQLLNAPQTVPALGYGPWCVTVDTAALVADNTNKCQINQGGGINASVTTIPYDTVTGAIPSSGSGYVDTEQIKWTGKTGTTSGNLTGVTRGFGGTTAATHADNAEIKLSSIQANCADLRVFINGKETNRWIANPNNASTLVWFNITLDQGYTLALKTAIASSGDITHIEFAVTPDSLNALTAMPAEGILVHGTEWIKYKGKDLAKYRLLVTERGVLGTTLQAHVAADSFRYMQHVITVCYGNTAAVAPATLDTKYDYTKPLFLLASSSNSSWVYDATTLFWDKSGTGRTGGFIPQIQLRFGNSTFTYDIKRGATSGNPAMGMVISSFLRGAGYSFENASLDWKFYRACGIDTTTFAGEKYRGDVTWPEKVCLQTTDALPYIDIWSEATPGSVATWTALASHSAVSMGNARSMQFLFQGNMPAGASYFANFEIQTGTINFVSANLPTGSLLSQATSAQLDLVLSNAANDDALEVIIPMKLGLALVLDGEAKTALYSNVNAHDVMALNDESRDVWLRLNKGDNILTILSVAVGTLVATLSWYRRRF